MKMFFIGLGACLTLFSTKVGATGFNAESPYEPSSSCCPVPFSNASDTQQTLRTECSDFFGEDPRYAKGKRYAEGVELEESSAIDSRQIPQKCEDKDATILQQLQKLIDQINPKQASQKCQDKDEAAIILQQLQQLIDQRNPKQAPQKCQEKDEAETILQQLLNQKDNRVVIHLSITTTYNTYNSEKPTKNIRTASSSRLADEQQKKQESVADSKKGSLTDSGTGD